MSKPIGLKGLTRIAEDSKTIMTFAAVATASKLMALDPTKTYNMFAVGAGPSNIVVEVTSDSKDAIANGTAKFAPPKTYAAMAAAGGFLGIAKGATGVRITHTKSGAGTDNAPTVVALGGRFQFRAQEVLPGATADTGMGAYTALTAT